MHRVTVDLEPDALARKANVSPIRAVMEVIWNSLDAEATEVVVDVVENDLSGVSEVSIADNGHGMTPDEVDEYFARYGASWKVAGRASQSGLRKLHGQEGEGRFRAFALGSQVRWITVRDVDGVRMATTIEGNADDIKTFTVDSQPATSLDSDGTRFTARFGEVSPTTLHPDKALDTLTLAYSMYLERNPDVSIRYRGTVVDPSKLYDHRESYVLGHFPEGTATMVVVEWIRTVGEDRRLVYTDLEGVVLHEDRAEVPAPGFKFTAFIRWEGFRTHLRDIELRDQHPPLRPVLDAARAQLRTHFRNRIRERTGEVVEQWKAEDVYPFKDEPTNPIDEMARDLFDVVATSVSESVPSLVSRKNRKSKALQLALLRTAIEQQPEDLQRILGDVLDLPAERRQELAELLDHTSLVNIIAAGRTVSNRLDLISALEILLFDHEVKREVLERAHLHEILEQETWVFGDEWALARSDKSLTECLKAHVEYLGRDELVTKPALVDGKQARPDLMFGRAIAGVGPVELDKRRHLVVELKRPMAILDLDHLTQVQRYAQAVLEDQRFNTAAVEWDFLLVGNDMKPELWRASHQTKRPPGLATEDDGVRVWAFKWSELLETNRRRLAFVQGLLEYESTSDTAMAYLQRVHAARIPATLLDDSDEPDNDLEP